ncbi:MAG TPA: hypothetical protein VKS01_02270, partial [Bryobacteraceae bacterium]|nr:hypothetical protein [Bryobacteraceae bacterium]
ATASGASKPLLLKPANDPSGAVTVVPGRTVSYNEDHYFSLDSAPAGAMPLAGAIKISSKRGWLLSDYTENFPLPGKAGYGETFDAAGSNGSHIRLRLIYPWAVQIYDRADIPGGAPALKQALLDHGFDSLATPAPLGASSDTNALWTGTAVPFTAVQAIVGVLRDQGVHLKKVEYHYSFEKSPEPNKIELGGSKATAAAPDIAPDRIAKIVSATSEADFKAALVCCEPAIQQQQQKKKRVLKK